MKVDPKSHLCFPGKLSTHQVCVSLSLQSLINRFGSKNFSGGVGEYLNTPTALLTILTSRLLQAENQGNCFQLSN